LGLHRLGGEADLAAESLPLEELLARRPVVLRDSRSPSDTRAPRGHALTMSRWSASGIRRGSGRSTSTTTTGRARTGRGRARAAGLCSRRPRGRWLRSRASVGFITNTAGGRR